MEKKKAPKKASKTVTIRITIDQKQKLNTLGKGNHRHGLAELIGVHKLVTQQPAMILNKDLELYLSHMETFCPGNHYAHFTESGLQALLRCFNNTGKIDRNILLAILGKRAEKPIDQFKEKEEVKADATARV